MHFSFEWISKMPLNDFASRGIQCHGMEFRIQGRARSTIPRVRRGASSSHGSKDNKATLGDRNLPQHVSPRCLCRISDNGYAYSCPDVMFPSGFTTNECNMLATRQRATNYLFHTYNDNGQPVESAQRTNSFRSSSLGFKSVSAPTVNKMMSPLGITNRSLSSSKRVRSSVLSRRSEKDNRTTAPRRESLVHEKEATIDDSSTVIIIRSLNRDLSPSARLERYLISLQRAGYLTSAKKKLEGKCFGRVN